MKKLLAFLLSLLLLLGALTALAEDQVLVDNEYVTMTIKSAEETDDGYKMKLELENKTDAKAMFALSTAVVNGCVADPYWIDEVAAGKKAKSTMEWDDLTKNDIRLPVTKIDLYLRIYNSDDWNVDRYVEDCFTLYPLGEENVVLSLREAQPGDTVLVDNDDFTVTLLDYVDDPNWGYTAKLHIRNKTDNSLMFCSEDVSVNDYMCDPYWVMSVPAKAEAYSDMRWSPDDFADNDIENPEKIELTLRVYNNDDWFADDLYYETHILTPGAETPAETPAEADAAESTEEVAEVVAEGTLENSDLANADIEIAGDGSLSEEEALAMAQELLQSLFGK